MTIWSSEIKGLEKLHYSIKESHPRLEKELSRLIKTDDENIVLVYARRCLEIIISDLCECELKRPRGSEPLKGIIDKLNREGKVPAHIIGSMNNINSISTFGSHPKAFDPRQVKPVLLDLNTTLGWYLKYDESRSVAETIIQENDQGNTQDNIPKKSGSSRRRILQISAIAITGVVIVVVSVFFIIHPRTKQPEADESLAKSIAVIPFQNFSADTDQEFMCLGLTDEIINHLFKIESFDKVISLSSVMTYIGSEKKVPEIADELEVNYILEGTYKKIGDQIRVTAQLIEAGSDSHLWQDEYDRPYEEIIAVQADIALQIADHIKVFISGPEKQRIQKVPTTNQRAYELVQEAQYFYKTWQFGKVDYGINLIEQALTMDPEYADAYAALAHAILCKGYYFGAKEMQSLAWEAMPYFKKALELDPENTQAIAGMAAISFLVQWDYVEAAKNYSKISFYLPSDHISLMVYLSFLVEMGHCEALFALLEKSEFTSRGDDLRCHLLQGNHSKAYALIPALLGSYGLAGFAQAGEAFIWLGDYDSARFYLEAAMQVPEEDPEILTPRFQADLALAYRMTGSPEQARTIIDQLIRISDTSAVGSPAFFTGWYYSRIGDVDSAFYWLEKAYENRSPEMPWLKMDPAFKSLKDDPRYWDLYERTGHKAYDEYLANQEKI